MKKKKTWLWPIAILLTISLLALFIAAVTLDWGEDWVFFFGLLCFVVNLIQLFCVCSDDYELPEHEQNEEPPWIRYSKYHYMYLFFHGSEQKNKRPGRRKD